MQFDENPAANIENTPLDDTRESIQQDSNRPQGSDNNKETENWNNRFFFSFSLKVVGAPPKKLKKRRKIKIRSSKEGRDLQRIDLELASCWDQVQILHLNSHPDARWGKAACP
jgi:hypothetical protein